MIRALLVAVVLGAFSLVTVGCHAAAGGSVGGNSDSLVSSAR